MMKKVVTLMLAILMALGLAACGTTSDKDEEEPAAGIGAPNVQESTESVQSAPTEDKTSDQTETNDASSELVDGMHPDFKEAMDSYEEIMNAYCDFMETYDTANSTAEVLSQYASYMSKYAEASEKLDGINQDELNTKELQYYLDVTNRVNQRLLEVAS